MKFILFILVSLIFMGIFGLLPSLSDIRQKVKALKEKLIKKALTGYEEHQKKQTAKDIIYRHTGRVKENIVLRSRKNARRAIGQQSKYRKIENAAMILGILAFVVSVNIGFPVLAPVAGLGGYLLPLWLTKFMAYSRRKFVDGELEVALSIISSSYLRQGDIRTAVSESLHGVNPPVKESFEDFLYDAEISSTNVALEKLKNRFENKIFANWCNILILCQEDKSMSSAIMPIVRRFAVQKELQLENELQMYQPIKQTMIVCFISVLPIFIYSTMGGEIWTAFVSSVVGQLSISLLAIIMLLSINRAIELSEPIEYNI